MKLRGLRQARQRRGISIGQLAEETGLRRELISRLEHGQEDPQRYMLHRLEAALGATAAELCASPGAVSVVGTAVGVAVADHDSESTSITTDELIERLLLTR